MLKELLDENEKQEFQEFDEDYHLDIQTVELKAFEEKNNDIINFIYERSNARKDPKIRAEYGKLYSKVEGDEIYPVLQQIEKRWKEHYLAKEKISEKYRILMLKFKQKQLTKEEILDSLEIANSSDKEIKEILNENKKQEIAQIDEDYDFSPPTLELLAAKNNASYQINLISNPEYLKFDPNSHEKYLKLTIEAKADLEKIFEQIKKNLIEICLKKRMIFEKYKIQMNKIKENRSTKEEFLKSFEIVDSSEKEIKQLLDENKNEEIAQFDKDHKKPFQTVELLASQTKALDQIDLMIRKAPLESDLQQRDEFIKLFWEAIDNGIKVNEQIESIKIENILKKRKIFEKNKILWSKFKQNELTKEQIRKTVLKNTERLEEKVTFLRDF